MVDVGASSAYFNKSLLKLTVMGVRSECGNCSMVKLVSRSSSLLPRFVEFTDVVNNEGPSSCAGHQGGTTTAPAPTCYAKTRLASYSIRFLASQHFNTDNSLHQCRAFILFLGVSTMRTFVYQFGIALRDAKVLAIKCAADKRGSRSTPNAYVAAVVTPILRHLHDVKGDETMHYDRVLVFKLVRMH